VRNTRGNEEREKENKTEGERERERERDQRILSFSDGILNAGTVDLLARN